jgi:tRNA(Ile)-lysidine synthase
VKNSDNMLKQVRRTIKETSMVEWGDSILVAVSGGADSVALLRALVILSSEFGLQLTTAHLNHGLRGAEADGEEKFVRGLCEEMGVLCICKKIDVAALHKGRGRSLEEVSRDERYRFLKETAEAHSIGKIATGHHRDDQAETVVMNLIRGSGVEGLKGIAFIRNDRVIRPLLQVSRREIMAFLRRESLTYMVDSSNLNSVFLRNRVRNNLIPELATRYNPRIVAGLCNMAEVVRREDDFLKDVVSETMGQLGIDPGLKEIIIPITGFLKLHEAIKARIIKHLLEAETPSRKGISHRHILAVLGLFRPSQRSPVSLDLPYCMSVEKEDDVVRIRRVERLPRNTVNRKEKILKLSYCYPVNIPGEVYLNEIGRNIRFEIIGKPRLNQMKSLP